MNKLFYILSFLIVFSITTINAQNYTTHRVQEGETIEGIAKRYYVTPFDIYGLNPDAKKGLKVNSVLIIPKSKLSTEPKVTIVKELQGFKNHRTSRKETLYSIAKEYNVTEEDIKKHNTFLYANILQKGDKLKIPIFKTSKVVETVELTKFHKVKPKETKWGLAYMFGITVSELESLNPKMGELLQVGQQIIVPNLDQEDQKIIDESYSYYKVLPKEGFYRLKLKLGVEQETLETLNPILKEGGLKEGMILKIPYSSMVSGIMEPESMTTNLADNIVDFQTKHIAVMLPFRINRVDFDSISGAKKSIKNDPYLDASLDFYSGVLIAIDSLKKMGLSLKVDVYDTKYEVSEVLNIINNNDFESVDAVIGPLTPNNFDKVASELRSYNTPIVSPIGTNLKLYDNVFQTRPSDDLLRNRIVNYVKADSLKSNIIIISDSKNEAVSNTLKREFIYAKQIFSRKNEEGLDANYVLVDDIKDKLKPGNNIVFLETQNDGFASNVTSILASLIQKENKEEKLEAVDIVLVTSNINSAFESDDINNTHLSKLQFHYASTSKTYNEEENNSFVKTYERLYNITPNKRAVKGFDLTMDVVLRLVTSENLYMSVNNAPVTEYVENKFGYKKKLLGGYYNDTVYLVKHQNLTIVEVK